jgi:hypothetical protein
MLNLPDVTLLCVDTRTPDLAIAAMNRCLAQVRFGGAVLLTDPAQVTDAPPGIHLEPVIVDSIEAYSLLILRGLLPHVRTTHLLVMQWDGYVLDAGQWDDEFLRVDYIGALWRNQPPGRSTVGNGGFSLRSHRLLQALQDPAMLLRHPEDTCICHDNRSRLESVHGIRFAPPALAARFSYERIESKTPTFGFHGMFNMHRVLSPEELHRLVCSLPDGLARGVDAHDLCATLIGRGQLDTAAQLLAKRQRLGMRDRRTLWLRWQLRLAHWRRRRQSRP